MMFLLAIAIGVYSYIIFFMGLEGRLTASSIWLASSMWSLALVISIFFYLYKQKRKKKIKVTFSLFQYVILTLILVQIAINLLGALGPELAFDALWYHLTLPKIYLLHHSIISLPGGLLYYADMPKLTEMLYTAALALHNEILAKLMHFGFGILILISLYQVARRLFTSVPSLLCCLIFSSNLVFAWESTTAYIDLSRTFFEFLALAAYLTYIKKKDQKWLYILGIMLGLAVTTKVLALFSLIIFYVVLLLGKGKIGDKIKEIFIITFLAILISLPWFIFSYLHTGNPLYPFFTPLYPTSLSWVLLSPLTFGKDLFMLFMKAADPISPLYLMILPLSFLFWKHFPNYIKVIALYSLLSILVWYLTPRTGGGRFILPYLPAISLLATGIIEQLKKRQPFLALYMQGMVIVLACITIGYRGITNAKFLPVVLGKESKQAFLTQHLNFSYGDFYDTDGYFQKHIKPTDTVLLYGFHNLYYVDFPFIHESWVTPENTFTKVAIQNTSLPQRFHKWKKVYQNNLTHVIVYEPPNK